MQRPRQLDRLHTLQPHLTVLAEQHALAQLDLAPADPEAGEAPGHPVDERRRARGRATRRARARNGWATACSKGSPGRTTRRRTDVTVVRRRTTSEADGGRGRCRRAGTRRTRGARGGRRRPAAAGTGGAAAATPPSRRCGRVAHRPARWASPRAASRLRRASASATGSPGSEPPLSGRGRVDLARGDAVGPGQWPGLDVDVLEPAVGDADEGAEQPALADDDLLVELDPRDRAHLAGHEPRRPQPDEHDGQRAEQRPRVTSTPTTTVTTSSRYHHQREGDEPHPGQHRRDGPPGQVAPAERDRTAGRAGGTGRGRP